MVLSKHTCLSTTGTETAGAGAASLPNFYLAEYFTCVSFISHPHVNQHRLLTLKMFMFSGFQHSRSALVNRFVAAPVRMIYVERRHFPFD